MQTTRLRTRLLISLLFAAALAFAGCGDNSQVVSSQNNTPSGDNNNNTTNNGDGSNNNDDTPDAGGLSDADDSPDVDQQPDADDSPDADHQPDADGPPDDPCLQTSPDEAAAFADDYAQALCERVLECDDNPNLALYVTFRDWTSVENCKADILAGSISAGQARAAAQNGTLTLNSCEADACLPDLASASCNGLHSIIDENHVDEVASCYAAWHGGLGEGTTCSVDAQCAGRQICERDASPDADSCTGTCVDAGPSGSGQCGETTCRSDQYCKTDNNICMSRPEIGEPCDFDIPCHNNAMCEGGECVAIDSGLGKGEACNIQNDLCAFDLICLNGSCAEPLDVGEDCNLTGMGCPNGTYCSTDEKCEEVGGPGASCTSDAQCRSSRCVDGSCTDVDSLCP